MSDVDENLEQRPDGTVLDPTARATSESTSDATPAPAQTSSASTESPGAVTEMVDIHPGYSRAVAGVVGAAALAVTAALSGTMTAIAVALIGSLICIGWPKLMGLPERTAPYPVLVLTLIASISIGIFGNPDHFAIVAAGALTATFVAEMFRRDGGTFRVEQLSGTFLGALMMITVVMWIPTVRLERGSQLTICIAVTIAVVALIHAFDSRISSGLGLLNGVITALAAAWLLRLPLLVGLLVGIAVGLAYYLTQRGVQNTPRPSPRVPGLTRALIPHATLGLFAYALAVTFL